MRDPKRKCKRSTKYVLELLSTEDESEREGEIGTHNEAVVRVSGTISVINNWQRQH